MPRENQILLNNRYPHHVVVINDNTEYDDTPIPTAPLFRSLQVIVSPRGRSNEFITIDDVKQFEREFGKADPKYFGQPFFNVHALVKQTGVQVEVLRVSPPDASKSNAVLVAKVRPTKYKPANDLTGTPEVPGKLEVRLDVDFIENLRDFDQIASIYSASNEAIDEVDGEGFVSIPLQTILSPGDGKYGNGYRFRVIKDTEMDKENSYSNYFLEVLEMGESGLRQLSLTTGTLIEESIYGGKSAYLPDILRDREGGPTVFSYVNDEGVDLLHELYQDTLGPAATIPREKFDYITMTIAGTTELAPGISVIVDKDTLNLDSPDGIPLRGGSDGSLDLGDLSDDVLEARTRVIEDLYQAAFRGELDDRILSKRRLPIDQLFDANYPESVKNIIRELVVTRGDFYAHLDSGFQPSKSSAVDYAVKIYPTGDALTGLELYHMIVRDPYRQRRMKVTGTHFLASKLPTHIINYGAHRPFAGAKYALITGHVGGNNSVFPVFDDVPKDRDMLDMNFDHRGNYAEALDATRYFRGTQSTGKIGTTIYHFSDMSEQSNIYQLLNIKAELEYYALIEQRYNFTDTDSLNQYKLDMDIVLDKYRGLGNERIEVKYEMTTDYEKIRSIVHCYVEIVFKGIGKRQIIEIDINPRS